MLHGSGKAQNFLPDTCAVDTCMQATSEVQLQCMPHQGYAAHQDKLPLNKQVCMNAHQRSQGAGAPQPPLVVPRFMAFLIIHAALQLMTGAEPLEVHPIMLYAYFCVTEYLLLFVCQIFCCSYATVQVLTFI